MVDVGDKDVTDRRAVAAATVTTTASVVRAVLGETGVAALPKGDVIAVARLAGIAAAKRTWELIPLCHQVPLAGVEVEIAPRRAAEPDGVGVLEIRVTARTRGRTGVEMEALTAATVASLTVHDMIKAVDPRAVIGDVRLLAKSGGRHGEWRREDAVASAIPATPRQRPNPTSGAVLVLSTSAATGKREDATGPVIRQWLGSRGIAADVDVVADSGAVSALRRALASDPVPALILTTGGTGPSPTDGAPEATAPLLARELPGVAEALRAAGAAHTPTAALSRGVAGVTAAGTVIVNLPGSPAGVRDGLAVLDPLLEHLLAQIVGDGAHGEGDGVADG